MDLHIKGRTALVLGAAGGLGGAMAQTLAAEGAQVAIADINAEAVEATASPIKFAGGTDLPLTWDIGELGTLEDRIGGVEAELGTVDILINNTGGLPPKPAAGQDPELWSRSFQSMVLSVIAITDRVLPGMKSKFWGRVITSTSSGVIAPIPNLGISNALLEVGRDGITVNIALPSRIATPRISFLDEQKAKREDRPVADVIGERTLSIPLAVTATLRNMRV